MFQKDHVKASLPDPRDPLSKIILSSKIAANMVRNQQQSQPINLPAITWVEQLSLSYAVASPFVNSNSRRIF